MNYLYQLQDLEVTQQALLNTVDPAWRLVGMGDFHHDDPFSANQLSDGTARFICMATLFLQPEWLKEYGMGDIWTKNLIGGRPEW